MTRSCRFATAILMALNLFALQEGNTAPVKEHPLGINLPAGVDPQTLLKLVAPQANPSLTTLVGMKKWPHRKNSYVAIVCSQPGRKASEIAESRKTGSQWCKIDGYHDFYTPHRNDVYLGVVEFEKDLKLIARTDGPLLVRTTDAFSNVKLPTSQEADSVFPESIDRFDFAKYKISDTTTAFGLRVSWYSMTSGGGVDFTGLMLFTAENRTITCVFSEPMGEEGISGTSPETKSSWATEDVLKILPGRTGKHFDLEVKEKGGPWKQLFVWDAGAKRYMPRAEEGEEAGGSAE